MMYLPIHHEEKTSRKLRQKYSSNFKIRRSTERKGQARVGRNCGRGRGLKPSSTACLIYCLVLTPLLELVAAAALVEILLLLTPHIHKSEGVAGAAVLCFSGFQGFWFACRIITKIVFRWFVAPG